MKWRIAAAVVALLTFAAAIIEALLSTSDSAPWWVIAAVAFSLFILAIAGPLLDWIKGHHQAERDHAGLIKGCTKLPVDDGRRLPLVKERTPEQLASRNSITQMPYLRRFAEDHVLAALAIHGRILVHGHSMAGKSRICAHLITQRYPHRHLLHPIPEKFGRLLDAYTPRNTVVWLDDLDKYLNAAGLRDDWDEVLTRNGNIIVATIRTSAYNTVTQGGEVRHPHADSLDRFKQVDAVVELTDSGGERRLLARQMPDQNSRALVATHGLGEYLGGGYLAVDRYRTCEPARYPYRRPVVQAAVDWRRIGLDTIPTDTLLTLAREYSTTRSPLRTPETPTQALEWATETTSEIVRLIDPAGNDRVRAMDFMLDHLSGPDAPRVPDITWATALTLSLSSTEFFNLGLAALGAERVDTAREAWQAVVDSHHEDLAPPAAFNLGLLEQQDGNLDAARTWCVFSINTGHKDFAAMAAFNLGVVEQEVGNLPAARNAYQTAIRTGHPEAAPLAAANLGALEHQAGNLDAARDAFHATIRTGHKELAPRAAVDLGNIEHQAGNLDAARTAYQTAIRTGHPDDAPKAAANLGLLEEDAGNLDAARTWSTFAMNTSHPYESPRAAVNLGTFELQAGNMDAARNAWQFAINSGQPEAAPPAAANLGLLEHKAGNLDAARKAWQFAINSGHEDHAPMSAFNLGVLEQQDGDLDAARTWYTFTINTEHKDATPKAAFNLGVLEQEVGNLPAARNAYQTAIDTGRIEDAPRAAVNLGLLEAQAGNLDAARKAWQFAINSGHPDYVPSASQGLRELEHMR